MARYKYNYYQDSTKEIIAPSTIPEAILEVIFNYADSIDSTLSKGLYDLLVMHDHNYRSFKGISTLGSNPEDEHLYFDTILYNQFIDFINNTLIPALQNETLNILQKLGGAKQLKNNESYYHFLVDEDHFQFDDDSSFTSMKIILWCEAIEEILSEAVSLGKGPVFYDN